MKYALILLALLTGCGMPETARSAKQAEQAVEGMGLILEDAVPVINEIENEEQREKLKAGLKKLLTLIQSARLSLQPAIAYLGDGKEIKVDTTPKEAATDPNLFATKAALQAGRAAVEVEDRLSWTNMFLSFVDPNSLEGWLIGLSTLLFGSGAVGLVVSRVIKTISTHKAALADAVAYGKEVQNVDPKDVETIESIKSKHAKKQKARGTKTLIDSGLQKVKDGTHA